jgi:hypothetical protein
MVSTVDRIDALLSTLNATELGTLESIATKFRQVRADLAGMEQAELADRAEDAVQALDRGDLTEFRRLKAFLQSKVGHLRR